MGERVHPQPLLPPVHQRRLLGRVQTQERVEEFYGETYFGGDADDYDIVKSGLADVGGTEISEGNDIAWRQLFDYGQTLATNPAANANNYWTMQGLNPDGTRNPASARAARRRQSGRLHADHLLHRRLRHGHLAVPRRQPGQQLVRHLQPRGRRQGFQFFIHDNEHSLGSDDHGARRRRTSTAPARSTTAIRTLTPSSIRSICTRICSAHPSTGSCSSTGCRNTCSTAAR